MEASVKRRKLVGGGFDEVAKVVVSGRVYEALGASVYPDYVAAYTGPEGKLLSWGGEVLGSYRVTASWRRWTPTMGFYKMHAITALVDGRRFHGRQGDMDLVRLRPYRKG